ncbi:MAG TPA: dTDP-glucose 4,6-dehydratase [Thermoplasmata archaeon]|nr:dTDP-glucose 4,6-dehydratase [Thermoplasmata archaeon]
MRVVVTGGAGFIGGNLLYEWARTHPEDELVTIDALTYAGHLTTIRPLIDARRVAFVRADIADAPAMRGALEGADLLIHLAAESHVDRSIAAPAPFVRTNVVGTQVLLDAARENDVGRVHHVSTDEVFGSLPLSKDGAAFDETSRYDPRSPYAASKAGADHLVRAYHHTYGLPVTLSNGGNNYGPYQHPEKLIPRAVTRLLDGGRVPVYGAGLNVRDWIHVVDHCRALDLIAHRGTPGATYLVGARCERTNLEVLRAILQHLQLPEERLEHVADRPGHDLRYALDPGRLERELGWSPSIPFEEGIRATVDWYRANRAWWEPLLPRDPSPSPGAAPAS